MHPLYADDCFVGTRSTLATRTLSVHTRVVSQNLIGKWPEGICMNNQLTALDIRMRDGAIEYFQTHLVRDADNVEPLIDLCWDCDGAPNTDDIRRALEAMGWPVTYLIHPTQPWATEKIGVMGVHHINCPYHDGYHTSNSRWLKRAIAEGANHHVRFQLVGNVWLEKGKTYQLIDGVWTDTRPHVIRRQKLTQKYALA